MSAKHLIVCVDDDPAVLRAVARSLSCPDLEVRATESATDALAWIVNHDVAVLISDYDMPEMTGAQLAGHAKVLRAETVRILLTGQRDLQTAVEGINEGEVFRFLAKPFDRRELRAAVEAALVRHRELLEASGERQRRDRRKKLRDALEREYPNISVVERDLDGAYAVGDAGALAEALGWSVFAQALREGGD